MDYRKLTKQLIAQVRELQDELNEAYDSMETASSYHEAENRRLHADLRQAEHERNQERLVKSTRPSNPALDFWLQAELAEDELKGILNRLQRVEPLAPKEVLKEEEK